MKLKLNDEGQVEVRDGKPVYIKESGEEVAFDVAGTVATISRLNAEAKGHRERAEKAESDLGKFQGIDDPDAARKAIQTVKNLDDQKLVDAGKIEDVKREAERAYAEKLKAIEAERDTLMGQLVDEKIGGSFARSKFIAEKLTVPAEFVEAMFKSNFSLDEKGRKIAKDGNGNQIYSSANPGEPASFEEAIEILVNSYSQKDKILKGADSRGTMAETVNGGIKPEKPNLMGTTSERAAAVGAMFPDLPER